MEHKLRGKDGGLYSIEQIYAANTKYNQQEKQNRLLEEQNKLLEKQIVEKANLERAKLAQEKELEKLKLDSQKEMQKMQMEHEEKMRILHLLDEVGLSKDSYDDFLKYLFAGGIDQIALSVEDTMKEVKAYEKVVENIDKYMADPKNGHEYVKEFFAPNYFDGIKQLKQVLEQYGDNRNKEMQNIVIRILKINPGEEFKTYQKQKNGNIAKALIWLVLGVIVIFMLISMTSSVVLIAAIYGVFLVFGIYYLIKNVDLTPAIKEKIKNIDEELNDPIKYHNLEDKILELQANYKKLIEVSNDYIKDMKKELKQVNDRWNEFVEFRKEHYNSKMEKLLLDLGLKDKIESLGINYIKVNNTNKIADGKIDDYITYFDEL